MTDPDVPDGSVATPPPAGSSPAGWWRAPFRHLNKITENPVLKLLIAIAEIAGLVSLIVGGLVRCAGDGDPGATNTQEPSAVAPRSPTSPAPSTQPSSSPVSTATGPRCWTSTGGVVDCREVHRLEEIPQATGCDQATVIEFLGGLRSLDITVARAAKIPGGGCSVDAVRNVAGSARDALQGADAAAWRRCSDRRTGKNVACSSLHSGEYLASGSPRRATAAECQVAAAKYLDQNPGNLLEDLEVRALTVATGTADPARCIIDARGNHLLTTSVRNLGSRPVPVYSQ